MVNSLRQTGLACGLALLGACRVHAGTLTDWHIGDTVGQDVIAPVAFDVLDPEATAERKAAAIRKTPVIFRQISSITNTMVLKFTAAFAESHASFLAAIQEKYQQASLDGKTIQSPGFADFLAGFNLKNQKLAIPADLARQWAEGGTGLVVQTNLVEQLLQAAHRPVRPDDAPDGFEPGDTVRLVTVRSSKEVLTLARAEQHGQLVSLESVTTVTRLRGLFRRDYSPSDLLFGRTLANFLHPDCELDTNLTQQARDRAISQIVVIHYVPGQIIVRRGEVIDARIQSALTQLSKIVPADQFNQQVKIQDSGIPSSRPPLHASGQNIWQVAAIASGSIIVLLVGWWIWASRRHKATVPVRLADLAAQNNPSLPPELAPQLAQVLKSVVVQELAAQRWELLQTQQNAAAEVVRLMQRLNDLHAPLQDRLHAYESRIQELEKELSARTEENRELLKLKIDLLRQQLEAERTSHRVNFN
jgi:hypothetical protein